MPGGTWWSRGRVLSRVPIAGRKSSAPALRGFGPRFSTRTPLRRSPHAGLGCDGRGLNPQDPVVPASFSLAPPRSTNPAAGSSELQILAGPGQAAAS